MFQISRKGFTLIELLVVMSIIGIMASLTVSSYLKSRNEEALVLSIQQISNDIRNVQNDAHSALKIEGDVLPRDGYGIRFSVADDDSKKKYIIFGDKDNDKSYDDGEGYLTVNLLNGVTVAGLKINGTEATVADVVFVPPYGVTYINNDETASRKLEITVAGSAGSRTIEVGVSGKVD